MLVGEMSERGGGQWGVYCGRIGSSLSPACLDIRWQGREESDVLGGYWVLLERPQNFFSSLLSWKR